MKSKTKNRLHAGGMLATLAYIVLLCLAISHRWVMLAKVMTWVAIAITGGFVGLAALAAVLWLFYMLITGEDGS